MYEDRRWWTGKHGHEVRRKEQWRQYEKGEGETLVRARRNHGGKEQRPHDRRGHFPIPIY